MLLTARRVFAPAQLIVLASLGVATAQEKPVGIGLAVSKSIAESITFETARPTKKPPTKPRKTVARRAAPIETTEAAQTIPATLPAGREDVHALVQTYAQRHGVPASLAHRVVMRESRYNPHLKGRAHFGLMQISLPTARQMGYSGAPQGLLEAKTNLAYGMPYLANAWLASGGNEARAVSLYSRGYYYEAKRKGLKPMLRTAASAPVVAQADAEVAANR